VSSPIISVPFYSILNILKLDIVTLHAAFQKGKPYISGQAKHRQTGCQFPSLTLIWISRGNRITVRNPMQKEEQDVAMTNNDD
jgi:hypothetical protein